MENLQVYYNMIDQIIREKGVDPEKCRGEKPGQWNMKRGSANVWIDVWKLEDTDYGYLQVMAPVVQIPTTNVEAFYTEILEINHKLYGVGMTKFKDWIYLKGIRELEDLSSSEANAMLNRVGVYADDYDDLLYNKYHGAKGGAPTT